MGFNPENVGRNEVSHPVENGSDRGSDRRLSETSKHVGEGSYSDMNPSWQLVRVAD